MNDLKFISAFGETLEISFHKDFDRKKKEIQQTISGLMEVFRCSQNENHSIKADDLHQKHISCLQVHNHSIEKILPKFSIFFIEHLWKK